MGDVAALSQEEEEGILTTSENTNKEKKKKSHFVLWKKVKQMNLFSDLHENFY